ncbi:MAG TPA: hypothetical protein VFI01_00120 [Gaiellaceae bacterium]|nr:hypothetical protein [Gaiellaceae bacterium]
MIVAGLVLAVGSTVAINAGYALQHAAASGLPPLTVRRPLASLRSLARTRRWVVGFAGGLGGWALYVVALGLAPLSLVQAASAGGIAVLALGAGRLRVAERLGVGVSVAGLLLLALSLGSHPVSGRGSSAAVAGWLLGSLVAAVAAARALPAGAGLGTAAGILYAAGDVATKAAVGGGARLLFVPAVLAAHGLAFVCVQLAFQRGRRLATAGLAVLWTNALPIVAGAVLFGERLPGGWQGSARLAAFAFVLAGAAALSRRTSEGSWATISTD